MPYFFLNLWQMSQNLSYDAVVTGALRVKLFQISIPYKVILKTVYIQSSYFLMKLLIRIHIVFHPNNEAKLKNKCVLGNGSENFR